MCVFPSVHNYFCGMGGEKKPLWTNKPIENERYSSDPQWFCLDIHSRAEDRKTELKFHSGMPINTKASRIFFTWYSVGAIPTSAYFEVKFDHGSSIQAYRGRGTWLCWSWALKQKNSQVQKGRVDLRKSLCDSYKHWTLWCPQKSAHLGKVRWTK